MDRAGIQKPLEDLTGDRWPKPPSDATRLMLRGHAARTKSASQLSVEDLRLLIAQQISLEWTVPFAIHELERDPLVEGDMYPGDLLNACLSLPAAYLSAHREVEGQLRAIARGITEEEWQENFPDRFAEWR